MPSSRSNRGKDSGKEPSEGSGSKKSKSKGSHKSIRHLIESLESHRVSTLTDLCRIERVAATSSPADAAALGAALTAAWEHYVTSNQFLLELRGLTRSYPLCADIIYEVRVRVQADPGSRRSWNLAWLVLRRMRDDGLIGSFAAAEAQKKEMWGDTAPTADAISQLAACFEFEWGRAVNTMLRHWPVPPTWY